MRRESSTYRLGLLFHLRWLSLQLAGTETAERVLCFLLLRFTVPTKFFCLRPERLLKQCANCCP